MILGLPPDDHQKIVDIINQGIRIKDEVKNLQFDFNDVLKDFCEVHSLPLALLKKAINVAFKDNFETEHDRLTLIGEILSLPGLRSSPK